MNIPAELKYTKSHEWVKEEDGVYTVGLTDYAQKELGDIVFINLPAEGDEAVAGEALADVESVKTVSDVFTWPVKGAVLRDFSLEVLSRDPTMGDWRTHSGLDLAAAQGVKVLAMSAGTVEQIYEDPLMGTTVVVDHGGGLQSRYSNLAAETAVREGDAVAIGQILGEVGGTAMAEVGMDSHLHLETLLDGQLVDPREYLPEQ